MNMKGTVTRIFAEKDSGFKILVLTVKVRVKLAEESHRFMGDHDQHVKLFAKDFSLVGFNLAQRFIELGLPQEFTAYGYLKSNCYRGKITKELQTILSPSTTRFCSTT